MSVFTNKKIILGVSGGIAAYKSAELLRLLTKQGAQVQVVMTHSAEEFVSALTFQALSGRAVRKQLFDAQAEAGMGHIELARWADLIVIAPASANTMAKIAHGMADNLLTTLCLATPAPIVIAPAMNQQMWHHAATQNNRMLLSALPSVTFCGPVAGEQACGDTGFGRMAEPEVILKYCAQQLRSEQKSMAGKRVLITAGPTIEDIDPVRFVSNRSSGKMGYAIAEAAVEQGAEVILISGPVALTDPENAQVYQVRSAQQMHDAVFSQITDADVFIATAAVADYRPVHKVDTKIKKDNEQFTIELMKNPDILADVAALKSKPFTVGFAAETNDIEKYAMNKLERKNLDMIAANKVGDSQGFEQDTNELHLFWNEQKTDKHIHNKKLPLASKKQLARQLISEITLLLEVHNRKSHE